jgi:hypothetical protein
MITAGVSTPPGPTTRVTAPRVAAWIGIVLSLLLLPVTIVGQATVTDQVDATADAVDARLAQAVPLVEAAANNVDALVNAVRTVAATAESVASSGGFLQTALDEVESFSTAFASSRASYEGAIDAINDAAERLEAVATLLPADVAQGLRDTLSGLENRVQQLEASVAQLVDAPTAGLVAQVAGTIAERARQVESAMMAVAGTLESAGAQLRDTRKTVSIRAGEITLALTVLAAVICTWLLYTAVLNWVLLRRFPAGDGSGGRALGDVEREQAREMTQTGHDQGEKEGSGDDIERQTERLEEVKGLP